MDDFRLNESECELRFAEGGKFFFLTLNQLPFLLFENKEEFVEGNNILAIAAAKANSQILDYSLMNNHFHCITEGHEEDVNDMVVRIKRMLRQYLIRRNKPLESPLEIRIDPIPTLTVFRKIVMYTDRNSYMARRDSTPCGYLWGAGSLFFNDNLELMVDGTRFNELFRDEKRAICHSRDIDLPDSYRCFKGMILKTCFVNYKRTESLFLSANQYFSMLLRHAESDMEIAKTIGESILLPNEDAFLIVSSWFPRQKIYSLTVQQRLEAAKRMKRELSSNNKQIAQVLRLPLTSVEEIFPVPR